MTRHSLVGGKLWREIPIVMTDGQRSSCGFAEDCLLNFRCLSDRRGICNGQGGDRSETSLSQRGESGCLKAARLVTNVMDGKHPEEWKERQWW